MMRRALVLVAAVAALSGTADAAAPVRGGAFCWDFDHLGTDGPDVVEATAAPEHVASFDGDDLLVLFGGDDCATTGLGNDVVHLGPGDDEAHGGRAADHLFGGPGNDVLLPGLGPDHADGGDGDDLIRDERGDATPDVLIGGPGHDVLRALNAGADTVDCGPGYDVAIVDAADVTTADCERVEVAKRPRLAARTLRTGVRPAFAVAWTRADLAAPARIAVRRVGGPPVRRGCDAGPWRVRGVAPVRLAYAGRRGACAGEYAFTLDHIGGTDGPRVACERLAGAPRGGCAPAERLGSIVLRVR